MGKDFNRLNIEVKTMDGGTLVTSQLMLADKDSLETVAQRQEIVAGKPGTYALNSRVRKAVKTLIEASFPKKPKDSTADAPGQTTLQGVA